MQFNLRKIAIFSIVILQFLLIKTRNFWECDTNSKVICQQTQTCCKVISNDLSKSIITTSFECFEGKNRICCGSKGTCDENEFCNLLLNKCQKIKITKDLEAKNTEKGEKKNYLRLYQPNFGILKQKDLKGNQNKLELKTETIKSVLNKIELIIIKKIPLIFDELKSIDFSKINVPHFVDGFMAGLEIFESAYRNSTCAKTTRILIDDSIEFINLLQHLNFDEHFFDKLHLAVDMLRHLYNDYLKQRKSCMITCHKIDCILRKIAKRFMNKEFPRQLAGHTICYYHELKKKVEDGCYSLKKHEDYKAGFYFGDALKFFAFWDFESNKDCN